MNEDRTKDLKQQHPMSSLATRPILFLTASLRLLAVATIGFHVATQRGAPNFRDAGTAAELISPSILRLTKPPK